MLRRRIMLAQGGVSLPAGYTKIEYLESDGSQFIDTGYSPNNNTRVVMEASLLSLDGDQYFYGAKDSGSTQSFVGAYSDGAVTFGYANSFPSAAFDLQIEEKMLIDQNREKGLVNGELVATANTATFQTPCTLYLCARNNDGEASKVTKARIYSCKIYDNGVKVRDHVPCTNPIGVKGLWDKVNEEFYALTPTGYTRLAYLESDGSDYIDTGFKPNSNTRVRFEGYNNSTSSGWIFGAWKAANNNMFCASALKTYNICYGTEIWANATMPVGPISIDINKNAYTYNGVSGTLSEQTFSCDYTMYLFHINAAGSVSTGCFNGRIYSVKMYDNGVLVRDLIPCTNPDGIEGLWDSVNGVFYKLLPTDYTRLDFIETYGATYIDTGFKPNNNTRVIFEGYNNNADSKWLFGTWNASGSGQFGISMQTGAGVRYGKQTAAITSQTVGEVYAELNKTAYNFNSTTGTLSTETFTCSYNLFIGALNKAGTPTDSSYGFIGRIYSVKIYDNGTLVRDFIPAMNASGEAGLYDLKNDVWYALLPVAKPKVENKITLRLKREYDTGVDGTPVILAYGSLTSKEEVASDVKATIHNRSTGINALSSLTIKKGANNSSGYALLGLASLHHVSPARTTI